MMDYKHTHIPAFGNWDYDQSSPITQYFESARQAGLLRYNYGEGDLYAYTGYYEQDTDLYLKPTHTVTVAVAPPRRKCKTKEGQEKSHVYYEAPHVKEQKKQRKVYDVDQTATQHQQRLGRSGGRAPKAVDEDLYKIPPELLCTTNPKKKRVYGFFSKCLMPSCAA